MRFRFDLNTLSPKVLFKNPDHLSLLLFDVGVARSPTRSRKLAKFFGEDTSGQISLALKTPSSKPSFLLPDYGPEDISFNADNQVRGGTLKGLVIKLTSHEGRESGIVLIPEISHLMPNCTPFFFSGCSILTSVFDDVSHVYHVTRFFGYVARSFPSTTSVESDS